MGSSNFNSVGIERDGVILRISSEEGGLFVSDGMSTLRYGDDGINELVDNAVMEVDKVLGLRELLYMRADEELCVPLFDHIYRVLVGLLGDNVDTLLTLECYIEAIKADFKDRTVDFFGLDLEGSETDHDSDAALGVFLTFDDGRKTHESFGSDFFGGLAEEKSDGFTADYKV